MHSYSVAYEINQKGTLHHKMQTEHWRLCCYNRC